jgi:hypothetical protein
VGEMVSVKNNELSSCYAYEVLSIDKDTVTINANSPYNKAIKPMTINKKHIGNRKGVLGYRC